MRLLLIASVLLLFLGCSQDGDVTVQNHSGPYLEVSMDGSTYLLDDGESVTKRIEVGRKFLFGPDDKAVAVSGEGECKWPFREVILVEDERNAIFTVHGDAGYIDVCNQTGYTLELYLSSCSDDSWGDPLELVSDGYCTTWMVEAGCWDMLAVTIEGEYEEYNIGITPCYVAAYDLLPVSLTRAKISSGLKKGPAREGPKDLKKKQVTSRAVKE
jgi:hypothetical protein